MSVCFEISCRAYFRFLKAQSTRDAKDIRLVEETLQEMMEYSKVIRKRVEQKEYTTKFRACWIITPGISRAEYSRSSAAFQEE
jgi:translation initiation factor 2B subunit (eIF-2B alpha/beta/delta family)